MIFWHHLGIITCKILTFAGELPSRSPCAICPGPNGELRDQVVFIMSRGKSW